MYKKYLHIALMNLVLLCGIGISTVYSPSHTLASLSFNSGVASSVGTLTAGTAATMSPYAVNTKVTQAHGLGVVPTIVRAYAECLTAEQGYSIGDRISLLDTAVSNGYGYEVDATNIVIIANTSGLFGVNKTTPAGSIALTAANWKIVAIPYRLN